MHKPTLRCNLLAAVEFELVFVGLIEYSHDAFEAMVVVVDGNAEEFAGLI